MLYEVLQYLNVLNYDSGKLITAVLNREFAIVNGRIELPELITGQHFVITGSVLNDGVYVYPAEDLVDETFTGTVHALRLPKAFLDIVDSIEACAEKIGSGNAFTAESFGGYSYTRATDQKGQALDAIRSNADRLGPWRML